MHCAGDNWMMWFMEIQSCLFECSLRTFVVHVCEEIVWSTGSLCTIRHNMLDDIQLVNSLLTFRRCDDATMYHNVVTW